MGRSTIPKTNLARLRLLIGLEAKEMAALVGCNMRKIQNLEAATPKGLRLANDPRLALLIQHKTGIDAGWLTRNDLRELPMRANALSFPMEERRYTRDVFDSIRVMDRIKKDAFTRDMETGNFALFVDRLAMLHAFFDACRKQGTESDLLGRINTIIEGLKRDGYGQVDTRKHEQRLLRQLELDSCYHADPNFKLAADIAREKRKKAIDDWLRAGEKHREQEEQQKSEQRRRNLTASLIKSIKAQPPLSKKDKKAALAAYHRIKAKSLQSSPPTG